MREWVDTTVERILALHPRHVLEIGCGTGLLLFRIAPECSRYTGVDFSAGALQYVRNVLATTSIPAERVQLWQSTADALDYAAVGPTATDTIIVNSVIQYFPSLDYLMQMLEGAIAALASGGQIFLGDLRGLAWLEEFQSSLQLYQASPSTERARMRQRIEQAVGEEDELLLDPDFFFALRERFPQISRVDVQLKRGRSENEMTLFRYDVVLHIGGRTAEPAEVAWRDWPQERMTLASVAELLEEGPEIVAITGIPNARLMDAIQARELIADPNGPATAGEIWRSSPLVRTAGSIPNDLGVDRQAPLHRACRAIDAFTSRLF